MSVFPLGLYVHIPFCSSVCHYCDFAKTANFQEQHVQKYLQTLEWQLRAWRDALPADTKFTSVFFGGGTPGLLGREYESLMRAVRDMLVAGAEVSLECNPGNVTQEKISIWKDLGFNRISVGVQTFDPLGLRTLTRDHSCEDSKRALELAAKHFPKSNGDLIYGWPGQDIKIWQNDLESIIQSGVNHLSLYSLTYEGQTPFARAERRGAVVSMEGDALAERYELACKVLGSIGFEHEEISNWSMPGASCSHNWLYWRGEPYIGIGAGAHGFVMDGSEIGLRYSYPGDLRKFLRIEQRHVESGLSLSNVVERTGGLIDVERQKDSWVFEYVGSALRCRDGVDLQKLARLGYQFNPNAKIERALRENILRRADQYLYASEVEWFRETAWSFEVCESLTKLHTV